MNDAAKGPIKWDKDKILAALRARASQGLALSYRAASESDSRLVDAARHHFGSYDAALREIGVDPDSVRKWVPWDKDKILAALRERQAKGLALNSGAVQKSDHRLRAAISNHFGSHDAALRAAGVDPDAVRLTGRPWDRGQIIAALRGRRDNGLGVNGGAVHESDPRLAHAIRVQFPSHDAALEAAGIDPESVRRRIPWDKALIVKALQERHARGEAMNVSAIQVADSRLSSAIHRQFDSHDAAMLAAGLAPPPRRRKRLWDPARVVAALRERVSRGAELNHGAIVQSDMPLVGAISRCFGSHDEALRAAGIDPELVRKRIAWDKPSVLAALRERAARGLALNEKAISTSDMRLVDAARSHFGSLDAALREMGLDPDAVRKQISWNKDKIIAALRDRRDKGLILQAGAMNQSESALAQAMRHHFGSHDDALRAAGIDPDTVRKKRPNWTEEKVIEALRGLARDGAVPWPLAKTAGTAISFAAVQRFGSIKAAAQAAGLRYERPGGGGHWTEDLVLKTLRDLHGEGHDLRHRHMKEHSQPLFFAAQRFFGSYVNAVRQAGIDYWQMSQAHLRRERAATADIGR